MKKNLLDKVTCGAKIFGEGFMNQIKRPDTIAISAVIGTSQGLKYNGNIVRGLKTGAAIMIVMGTVGGFINVTENWNHIKTYVETGVV